MIEFKGIAIEVLIDGRYKVEVDFACYIALSLDDAKAFIEVVQ